MTHPEAIVLVAANLEDVRVSRKTLAERTGLRRHHTMEEGMTNVTAESGLLGNPFLIVILATAMAATIGLFGRRRRPAHPKSPPRSGFRHNAPPAYTQ